MKLLLLFVPLMACFISTSNAQAADVLENRIVPSYMLFQGAVISGLWAIEIAKGRLDDGFFHSREDGRLFWPHMMAEFATAATLIIAAIGLFLEKEWGTKLGFVALGATVYTSLNSLHWSLAEKERYPTAIPMFVSLGLSSASIVILF